MRSGLLGQAAMLCAFWVLFYVEAIGCALAAPAFALPHGFPGAGGQFDAETVHRALLHLCLFQLMLLVGYASARGLYVLARRLRFRIDAVEGFRPLQVFLAAFIVLALGSVYHWDWTSLSRAVLGSYRVRMGQDAYLLSEPTFLTYLLPVGLYGIAVLFVSALDTRGFERFVAGAFAAAGTIFVLLLSTRHYLLVILVPVGAAILRRSYRRLTARKLFLWGFAALSALYLFQAQVAVRGSGWESLGTLSPRQILSADLGSQFQAMLFAESLVPREHDFFKEPTPLQFVTFWVPRRFWPGKPADDAWTFFDERLTNGSTTYNVTPTAIGQFYMGFGIVGVGAIGCFLGMLCRFTDDLIASLRLKVQNAPFVFLATLYVLIINSLRYFAPFYLWYSVAAFAGMMLLTRRSVRSVVMPSVRLVRAPHSWSGL
jgi:oligosaccharide repeat unit polymerase